ncbi:bifunctional riboflavin kinase/FAD synthetase [Roseicyclus sp. F158]|uniref:Riboflavin biosynthesis protein n=1 Tax=Tropicimonas omnivorans TaxID=3075590 RepID=A0ABU3DFV7_9RHOB|nr:bifunctional riboflavin kinase/FAD synthetase [Roseicyclus sp. F158]MDT0682584.1 bifunctional riboflavin kinase/FAD synthetase [Roseicyclus sp. F158]
MRRIRTIDDVLPSDRGACAAIGNFDGVHLGHQAILDRAREAAPDASRAVLTFEPHPREVFAPEAPPFRLMRPDTRAHRLEKLGLDLLFEIEFDRVRGLSPEAFCAEICAETLGLTHAVVGEDFRFGKGRAGDAETFARLGETNGFGVTILPAFGLGEGSSRVSSSGVRAALEEGRPRDAAAMLGHWHRVDGPVEHGDKRGRTLGYPTANLGMEGLLLPKLGVYAVLVDILDGPHAGSWQGVASLGVRPMFDGGAAKLETFLFDFDGDLYGTEISVALVEFLRPEETFDGVETLIAQMDRDKAGARAVLEAL